LLQYQIDNATAENKEKRVRELVKLYDQHHKYFPKTLPTFEISKAMTLYNNQIEAKEEILSLLESGFTKASKDIKDAGAIYTYFSLCYDKYKSGDALYNADVTLDRYSSLNALLTELQNTESDKINEYKTAQRGISALAKDLVNCDNLEAYFQKNFNNYKDNEAWLTTALNTMANKCSANPVFITIAERLHGIKPSSKSAYFMALASLKQRKFNEAIQFYNQAADLETNLPEKAKIYFTLGTGLLANDMPKSKEALNKALQADPSIGKAYIFLGQLYANSANECGKTNFEKKAIYTLASQTVKKATLADPKLKTTADKLAQDFDRQAFTSAEITKEKMNGKTFTIGCWINETLTFPAK
jgi:hypothetical protein